MKDAIAHMEAQGTPSQMQDIRKAKVVFTLHGIEATDLDTFPANLTTFELRVPKLNGTMPGLQRLIHAAGISDNTYKQAWRAARRLIAEYTGATTEKQERRGREDAWAELHRKVTILVEVGIVDRFVLRALPALTDACRVLRIAPNVLDCETAAMILNADGAHQRKTLRKGLKALDDLREISRLADLLPAAPVTPAPKKAGRLTTLPPHLQTSINGWVKHAAREQVDDVRYDHLAEPLSQSAQYSYSAALSLWIGTLLKTGADLNVGIGLAELFRPDRIDSVLGLWSSEKTHAARTAYRYTTCLAATLSRHGLPVEAAYAAGMPKIMTRLREGRAAGKKMGPKVQRWCEALLRDPRRTNLFQIQHLEYYRLALNALATAKAEDIVLTDLSHPARMAALPDAERYRATHLMRQARMFGVLATYAAIALEGAPYRRQNMLSLRHTGPNKTIFLHLGGRTPHAIVKFPNEELKNGKWLTERGEELESVTIENRDTGDYGTEVLMFYMKHIRPLFPEADKTHCLFPPIERAHTSETHFVTGTFDVWLAEGSAEIGLPLTSHNFRHGFCSIDINEGRRSIEDLAKIMGDSVDTLQRHYAWMNARKSVAAVQKDAARRRADIMKTRKGSVQ